jgi:hypothetical protein
MTTSMTTFDASVEFNQSVEKQMAAAMAATTIRMVEFLASEYEFNAAEAIQRLGLVTVSRPVKKNAAPKAPRTPKEKRMVPSIPLPFCGMVKEDWCCGLRLNHGLYSQCTMPKGKDTDFCKTCIKQVEKNENNKPTYGVVQERMAVGPMEFRDPKGKAVVCYGNVMSKLNISKETAIAEAAKFGFVIEEEQFEERKTARGRPKKDATASDTESENSEKKLGRPKKNKKVVTTSPTDDLIASLVATAKTGPSSDGSESDDSVKSDISVTSVKSTDSTSSKKAKKAKVPKPELTDEEKVAKKAATAAKRAATIAAKPELTEEEKAAKKAATAAKRAATKAAKAAKEADMAKPAAIIGVTVPADPVPVAPVAVVDSVAQIVEAVAGPPLVPPVFQAELVEEVVSDSDDDDMEVERFAHNGVTYLYEKEICPNGVESGAVLYDPSTQLPVGVWNDALNQVDHYDASKYEQIPVDEAKQ